MSDETPSQPFPVGSFVFTLAVVAITFAPLLSLTGWSDLVLQVIALSIGGLLIVLILRLVYQKYRLREYVRNNRGRVCPACLSSLRGLPRDWTCPECGTPFSQQSLISAWGASKVLDPEPENASSPPDA